MTVVVRARELCKDYLDASGLVRAIDDVSFDLPAGELVLLMGPSGSGKTTLATMIAGLLAPTSGDVEIDGASLSSMSEAERAATRRRAIGFVFQTHNLFPALSAVDNVALGHRMRGADRSEACARARHALEALDLGARAHHRPAELSAGQQQRVAIARALAGTPSLLVADEPTAALDGANARAVMELLRARLGTTTAALVVTHDHRLESHADRVLMLEDGRLTGDIRAGRSDT